MRLLRALSLSILLCWCSFVIAQEPYKVTEKFFPKPQGVEISTPGCTRAAKNAAFASTFTTCQEATEVMQQCARSHPEWFKREIIGTSQRGLPITAWKISDPEYKGEKLRVLYLARMHGDEPSGTEALLYFAQQLVSKPELKNLLSKIDFYLIPMLNVDGATANKRRAANNLDLNRDQSLLRTPESYALQSFVDKIQPQVAVDFHEYFATNDRYTVLSSDTLSIPWDVMTSCTKNQNVPRAIRMLSEQKFEPAINAYCDQMRWQHEIYTTGDLEDGKIVFTRGGVYPTTITAVLPLKNVITFLVETRRTSAHNRSLERRAWISYSMAVKFARISASLADEIRLAGQQAQSDTSEIVVRFAPTKAVITPFTFLNMHTAEYQYMDMPLRDVRNAKPKTMRPFPKGYYVLPDQTRMREQLDRQDVVYKVLQTPVQEWVEAYHVVQYQSGKEPKIELIREQKTLPAGTLYISMQQRNARWITLMLEPEAYQSYLIQGLITVNPGDELPYFRK